jgi:hypothetical protein
MTTVTNTVMNNPFWNNMPSDQLPNIDVLFSSTFDFIYNQQYDQDATLIKEDYEETSSDVNIFYNYILYLLFSI